MIRNPHVVIIGAGVSGIAAARTLFDNGFSNTKILEAENRIGGRINTVNFNGKNIELGAQWCHGEDGNIIYNLVKDLNVLDASFFTYKEFNFYTSAGEKIDKDLTDTLTNIFYEITYDVGCLEQQKGSFGDYFLKSFNERIKKQFPDDSNAQIVSKKMIDWFEGLTLCYDAGTSWFDVSASGLLQYEECNGNLLLNWKDYGYCTLLDVLMKRYPDKSNSLPIMDMVEFNKEVNQISWFRNNSKVNVRCSDGSLYKADHVIVTTSLGVLKENFKNWFLPELPSSKQNAIQGLGIGVVNKIFLKFSRRWWPKDSTGFSFVWGQDDNLADYCNNSQDKSWVKSIFGFYTIDSDPDVLMGWSVGKNATKFEQLPKEIVADGCLYILRKFLRKEFTVPRPIDIIWSTWGSNPHFLGSYSYRSVESDRRKTSADELSQPLIGNNGEMLVLFGGEATHPNFYSSAHGALESGFREANRIIDFYRNPTTLRKKVVIIGAGMAGLGAAKTLTEFGVDDFVILEAKNKAGGRIETLNINGNIIELGAQWLHDTSNYLYELAAENGLIAVEMSDEGLGIYLRDDGYVFDEFMVKKVDFIVGQILEDCEKFTEEEYYPKSVGEFLTKTFLEWLETSGESEEYRKLALELFDWHVRFQVIDNSCLSLDNLSAKYWGEYSCLGKDGQQHMNIKNGYQALVDLLVAKLPSSSLRLECPVVEINYSMKDVVLTCQSNNIIIADHVIITSSIGYLKENLPAFKPELPNNITGGITDMGFHGMGKIYLVFDRKWWTQDGFQLIWRKETELPKDRQWLRCLTGFDNVLNQPNILVGWIGGEGITDMEKTPENLVGEYCVDMLRTFLKDTSIPYPQNTIRSSWSSCPWIRGGYSHTTPKCDQSGFGPSALSTPVEINGVPKLLFTGEASHDTHFSTTHGAFESGERSAGILLNFLRKPKL